MDGSSSAWSNLMVQEFCGFSDLQGSMQINSQQNPHRMVVNHEQNRHPYQSLMIHPQQDQDFFSFRFRNNQKSNQPVLLLDYNKKGEGVKNSASNDFQLKAVVDSVPEHVEGAREKMEPLCQRMKWTDEMLKLLITAVSYIGEDALSDGNGDGERDSLPLSKKGKWRAISKVLVERGFDVSPQQCEDKFNDMNRKYRRLNDILGRGISCEVVENPVLMDLMDLPELAKGDVMKILSSKQLFYPEMCSYHNGNRLFLPHDRVLQQSLHLALKSKASYVPHSVSPAVFGKRKQVEEHEVVGFGNAAKFSDSNIRSDPPPPNDDTDVIHVSTEAGEREDLQNQSMVSRSLQLQEQKFQIQAQMLELEKRLFKWLRRSQKKDRKLDEMRLENECMKLENGHLALELRSREMGANSN